MSDDLTDEELAAMETAFQRSPRYQDLRSYGLRLVAALRATREALADTQKDLVDARHDLDQARMDDAKRLVDYRASREEAERQRVQLLRHHATKDVEKWGRPCAVCDAILTVDVVQ